MKQKMKDEQSHEPTNDVNLKDLIGESWQDTEDEKEESQRLCYKYFL